jgi:alginate O-acetyltransferase complex protein AlgI
MFPQLIAGPILRFHVIAPQIRSRIVTAQHIYFGFLLFCVGLGQKVLIADTLATVADPLFASANTLSTGTAWLAAITYSFQLYFDFSGYSHMAIGLGWMTGFNFPQNFNFPYISRSITEFWRRWHISLSSWFRDYLYIPLGGNRGGPLATYRNLIIVFLLCGLWHGAGWTFVAWGAYHGTLLVIERLGWGTILQRLPPALQHLYAILAVVVGWVVFRSESLPQAGTILSKMFTPAVPQLGEIANALTGEQAFALLAAMTFSMPFVPTAIRSLAAIPYEIKWSDSRRAWRYAVGLLLGLLLLLAGAIKILSGSYSPFIYFRF